MFYLVPPLVVIEAHYLFGETLGVISIAGMLVCVVRVYSQPFRQSVNAADGFLGGFNRQMQS
jgi:hypothetical protein